MSESLPADFDNQKDFHVLTQSFFGDLTSLGARIPNPFCDAPLLTRNIIYSVLIPRVCEEGNKYHNKRTIGQPRYYANQAEELRYFFDRRISNIESKFMGQIRSKNTVGARLTLLFFLYNYTRCITAQFVGHQSILFERECKLHKVDDIFKCSSDEAQMLIYNTAYMYFPTLIDVYRYLHNNYFKSNSGFIQKFDAVISTGGVVLPNRTKVLQLESSRFLYVNQIRLTEYFRIIMGINEELIRRKRFCSYY